MKEEIYRQISELINSGREIAPILMNEMLWACRIDFIVTLLLLLFLLYAIKFYPDKSSEMSDGKVLLVGVHFVFLVITGFALLVSGYSFILSFTSPHYQIIRMVTK